MSAASTYPTAVDALPTTTVDNPDVSIALIKVQETEKPRYVEQKPAFAAEITPDPRNGEVINVGTLTGNITIANPPAAAKLVGRKITFKFTQDGTGGRTIAFGTEFKVMPSGTGLTLGNVTTAASKVSTVVVQWDGTAWTQVGGATGM